MGHGSAGGADEGPGDVGPKGTQREFGNEFEVERRLRRTRYCLGFITDARDRFRVGFYRWR